MKPWPILLFKIALFKYALIALVWCYWTMRNANREEEEEE